MNGPMLPGLPEGPLTAWLERVLPELGAAEGWRAELISGGLSNITYRLHTSVKTIIIRRPPLGGVLASAHDMVREHRVLTALAGTGVPVPTVLAICTDKSVIGADFYAMDEVPGVVMRTSEDTARLTPETREAVSRELVDVLASIHSVSIEDTDLGDFSRPSGYVERQLGRWHEQSGQTILGKSTDMTRLFDGLTANIPPQQRTALLHGDFKLDNLMVSKHEPSTVLAVVDWELSTLGDPMADLGLALTYWHDLGDEERSRIPVARGVTSHEGFYSGAEFAGLYASKTATDLVQLEYFLAFGSFKLAAILAGVHSRYENGHTAGDYPDLTEAVPTLASRGLRHLANWRRSNQFTNG